jgi:hypothetical protein
MVESERRFSEDVERFTILRVIFWTGFYRSPKKHHQQQFWQQFCHNIVTNLSQTDTNCLNFVTSLSHYMTQAVTIWWSQRHLQAHCHNIATVKLIILLSSINLER